MEVTAEFELSNSDVADSARAFRRSKILRIAGLTILPLAVLNLILLAATGGIPQLWSENLTMTAVTVMFALFGAIFLLAPRLASLRTLRNVTPDERRINLRFGAEGYRIKSGKAEATVSWEAVHRVVEGKEGFLFFISDQLAHFLPKRVLSAEEAERIRALVRAHVKPRKAASSLLLILILSLGVLALLFSILREFDRLA